MITDQHIIHQVLGVAKGLIQKGWTTGVMARDANGSDVDPLDPAACQWCLVGALYRAFQDVTGLQDRYEGPLKQMMGQALFHLRGVTTRPRMSFDQLNDQLGRQVVLDLIDRGLAKTIVEFEAEPS